MRKYVLLLILSSFFYYNCSKNDDSKDSQNDLNGESSITNEKSYFSVMTFTVEDQIRKEQNERFARFNVKKLNPITTYVSDVEEYKSSRPMSEDLKYKKLDLYEKYVLKPSSRNYIIIDRDIKFFDSYAKASRYRQGEIE